MTSASKVLIAATALFALSANADVESRKEYRRLDCRFYSEKKCDDDKCDKKCDKDDKCDKKCDKDDKKCEDKKLAALDETVLGKKKPNFCYVSATYWVSDKKEVHKVHYGVGCDRQTIYDNQGIIEPQETVADHIRPRTAATPLVELEQQNDLRTIGSYTAKLELDSGILFNGHCYVTGDDDDMKLF